MKQIEVLAVVDTASGSPVVLLGEQDAPHRTLPIAVGSPEAVAIALALRAGSPRPSRPLTHDLLAAVVETLDAHVDRAEVTGVHGGTFVAELAIDGPGGGMRLDSRPSDAIALVLRVGAPLFASEAVLDEAGQMPSTEPDAVINHHVARFRAFLDETDPTEFGTARGQDEPPDEPLP